MTPGAAWHPVNHTGAGGLGENHLVTNGVTWRRASHTGAGKKGVNQKTGCLNKKRQPKAVRVELRAGGDLHGSEKPGWSAGDTDK